MIKIGIKIPRPFNLQPSTFNLQPLPVNATLLPLLLFGWWESVNAVRAPKPPQEPPPPPPPLAYEFRIDGDRITIRANDTPLQQVLADFVRAGVKVKVDPAIDARVSGYEKDLPVDKALEKLLGPFGYVIFYTVVPGPLGNIERLDEVHVFRREGPRQLEEFMPEDNFRITRGPLPDSPEFVADELLIALKPGTSIDQFRTLLAQIGASVIDSVPELGIYRLRLPPGTNILALVDALKNQSIVSRVEPNYAYRLPPGAEGAAAANRSTAAGAASAAEGAPRVAVLDSGLRAVSSLDGLVAGAYDAIRPEREVSDTAGHGTQMALIASGAIPPYGASGSASGVPVLAIRAFDDNGITSNFTLMRAIEYAAAQGAKVVNLSWGSTTPSSFMETAVQKAIAGGMVVVASAGNEPTGQPVYPAAYGGVLSVSALEADGAAWSSSNFGGTVDLAAPGTATLPVGYSGPPGGYAGTSIAAAYVSHAVALYMTEHPTATAADARRAVMGSLSAISDTRYGQGALDAAALERLLTR